MLSFIALTLAQGGKAAQPAAALAIQQIKEIENLHPLAFAQGPSGSKFAVSLEDCTIRIMDANTRQTLKTFRGPPQQAYALAWSHDGELVAAGDESGRIFVWNAETGSKLQEWRKHTKGVQALSFNYPGTLLLSTGKDDTLKIWDMSKGKDVKTILGQGANFYGGTFRGKTNDFGVGILGYGARMYSGAGNVLGFLTGHNGQGVFDIAFNPNGTRAVTAGRDGQGALWDTSSDTRLGYLKGDTDQLFHAAFSPNGKLAATSSVDRTVRVWNTYSMQSVAVLQDQSAIGSPLCFTEDGKFLLTAGVDDGLQIHSVTPPQSAGADTSAKAKKPAKKKHH